MQRARLPRSIVGSPASAAMSAGIMRRIGCASATSMTSFHSMHVPSPTILGRAPYRIQQEANEIRSQCKDYPTSQTLTVAERLHRAEVSVPPAHGTFRQARRVDQAAAEQLGLEVEQ